MRVNELFAGWRNVKRVGALVGFVWLLNRVEVVLGSYTKSYSMEGRVEMVLCGPCGAVTMLDVGRIVCWGP